MTTPYQDVPHLAFPFTVRPDGTIQTVPQDSLDEIAQCVRVLIATPLGSRENLPDYGLPDPTFAGVDPAAVSAAVAVWEPRAAVTVIPSVPPTGAVTINVARAGQ